MSTTGIQNPTSMLHSCNLPLYIFCGDELLYAKLKTADGDAGNGSLLDIQKLVGRIRERWPEVRIVLRGDSGFCRDGVMSWCERNGVLYVFGLAKNTRLRKRIEKELKEGDAIYGATDELHQFKSTPDKDFGFICCIVNGAEDEILKDFEPKDLV
jgi:hypothetical protein